MAKILCRTKGNASPKGKPRVYFTCHPADFDRYFDSICQDIFKAQDCAIFYTEDMGAPIAQEDQATDLESNNLFVVPVTYRLLSQPNRAMDSDIPFALEKHIPVLPFLMESGIDRFYGAKFGELQYLNPHSTDATEISYPEKLKKYLQSVLISDETAKRIRAAFDAYIFLSYRKKDRRHANELMRLIHRHPQCRDIAIWYDEFLTPGESFRANIEKILGSSKLFALLVTPSLLEEPEGKPNFVMGEEYPAARKAGIDILPAEMEETDQGLLRKKFEGIPSCLDPRDKTFQTRLLESVAKIATAADDKDPGHNFLIGLAYLEGIDVEVERQRGLELITSAAEADLPEAMEKLFWMYSSGNSVALNYREAAKWAQRLVDYYQAVNGAEHETTLAWMNDLATTYCNLGEYQKSLALHKQAYSLCRKALGEKHLFSILSLGNLALSHYRLGQFPEALELHTRAYALRCEVLGEDHPETVAALDSLAMTYGNLGIYGKALEYGKRAYALSCRILGEEHPSTLFSLENLAATYCDLGEFATALELTQKAHDRSAKVLGKEHPNTLTCRNNLALIYDELGYPQKALEINQETYALRREILGEIHPDTLVSMNDLATTYGNLGNHAQALKLHEKTYALRCEILGKNHPDTVISLSNLAVTYENLGDIFRAAPLYQQAHSLLQKSFGSTHPLTQKMMDRFMILCRTYSLCPHCGGRFQGLFRKKCSICGNGKGF